MPVSLGLCPVLVGRAADTAALAAAAAEVPGRGRLVLVGGEAGVGKSRLVGEAVRIADGRGFVRLVGGCTPDATAPYAPLVGALRRLTRTMPEAAVGDLFAGPASLAASLLPEALPGPAPAGSVTSPDDLYAALWQLLGRVAGSTGALLVLEDLHWAGADMLRLLTYLARELDDLGLWVLGTYRTDEMHRRHPLRATLAELARERRFVDVRLSPLDREEVRAMLSAIFDGTQVGDEICDAILERTGGNPFFVEELAKVLIERGDVYRAGQDWERRSLTDIDLPFTVRDTLLARLRDLDEAATRVLQAAAVAGDRIDEAVVLRAAGVDRTVFDDVLRQGLERQLLMERREGALHSYAFRHALTREALADDLVGPDRSRVHRAVAEAIEKEHAEDIDAHAAQVADHYARAGEPQRAAEFALRAARVAAAACAVDEAVRRFDQVLDLVPRESSARLGLLLEAAESTRDDADMRAAVAYATEAERLGREAGDAIAQVRALLVVESARWHEGDGAGAIAVAEQAHQLVHERDDWWEAVVLRRRSRLVSLASRYEEAAALTDRGIELARRSGNAAALAHLLGTRMQSARVGPERFYELYSEAVAAAVAAADLEVEGNTHVNAGYICLWRGHLRAAADMLRRGLQASERARPNSVHYPQAGLAWCAALTGEYAQATSAGRPLTGAGVAVPTRIVALTAMCEVAERTGSPDLPELVATLTGLAGGTGESQRGVPAMASAARLALNDGDLRQARPMFWEVLRYTLNPSGLGSHWQFSADYAAALAAEGLVDELAEWVTEVERITASDPHEHNGAAGDLCAGHLALARGEPVPARAAFARAAARYAAMPCPARQVEALLGEAAAAWRQDDAAGAAAPLSTARAVAEGLGARQLLSRIDALDARLSAPSVLATVLFTDIVGSTERAVALGDRGWSEHVARHHAIVRRELDRSGGREVDTAGDGFLAAFDSPAQAIRCADDICAAVRAVGLQVRAGIHTGECQLLDGKLVGVSVHIAARVAALAGPGEVLVSGTVRDLVAGSGLAFDDRGRHSLRGVPGEWAVHAVRSRHPAAGT